MSLKLHDTLGGEKRDFEPIEPGKVGMYVCGVTPYARCHIGHARCYTAFDIVYRYLKYRGFDVTYVRNFTDVDDKIIARAREKGVEPVALAGEHIVTFYEDMDALGIARPQHEPRVSGTIPEIIALVERLIERGYGYVVDGDVYYEVSKFTQYGKLSGRKLDDMQAGARVAVDERKRHPMDFALWKSAKPGEPEWHSPWGPGRPGWHIECSAMSMSRLGATFDIHGGGADLVFPHHENEIAQSEGASGEPYVRYWLHNGFVNINDEKMSKSLGNTFDVGDLLSRYEPQVIRLFMLSTHYRSPINFSDRGLDEAAARMAYFYETLRKVDALVHEDLPNPRGPLPGQVMIDSIEPGFREAMDDDFNVVRALGVLAEVFKQLNELASTRKKKAKLTAAAAARQIREALGHIDDVLNLFGEPPVEYLARHRDKAAKRQQISLDWIAEQVAARETARAERDWSRADELRGVLEDKGVVLMDTPTGTDWTVDDVPPGAAADAST